MESVSCVTSRTAVPESLMDLSSSITFLELSESRSDVGSSAIISPGEFTRALAMEALLCSPPDSFLGYEPDSSERPTLSSSSEGSGPVTSLERPICLGSSTFSRTVRFCRSPCPWGMYPILRFLRSEHSLSESPEMSFPSRKTCPDVGFSTPAAMFNSYSDLGFKNGANFADSFVDDSLIQKALTVKSWDTSKTTTLKFSFIVGDLHQLPVHLAAEILPGLAEVTGNSSLDNNKTLFEQAGLDIVSVDASGSGQVITQMQSGEADFGVAGQPGIIAYDINNKLTTA